MRRREEERKKGRNRESLALLMAWEASTGQDGSSSPSLTPFDSRFSWLASLSPSLSSCLSSRPPAHASRLQSSAAAAITVTRRHNPSTNSSKCAQRMHVLSANNKRIRACVLRARACDSLSLSLTLSHPVITGACDDPTDPSYALPPFLTTQICCKQEAVLLSS